MRWDSHINNISNKIPRAIGIINQMKKILPFNILLILYKTLILPHINYVLCWGYQSYNIFRLQKKIVRIITHSKYYAHTDALFKELGLLKVKDFFRYITAKILLYIYKRKSDTLFSVNII